MLNPGRILIAEQDDSSRDELVHLFTVAGHRVSAFADGPGALQALQGEPFDVFVLSVELPGISGFDLFSRIRSHDEDVPVILLSGTASIQGADHAMELRAFRYYPKPVAAATVLDAANQAVRQVHNARERKQTTDAMVEPDDTRAIKALAARFDDALRQLWMAYQPIVRRSTRSLFAYEAFVRAKEPALDGPAALFQAARRLGRSRLLEQAIRTATHPAVAATDALIFINLAADGLADEELYRSDTPLAAVAHRVVLELSERSFLEDVEDIPARIARLRKLGFRIALNDMGSGHSGLNTFAAIEPEVIKLDMSLTRGIERSTTKQRVVKSIVDLCEQGGTMVVAEGVESREELDTLAALGCDYFQGHLFARAGPAFPGVIW